MEGDPNVGTTESADAPQAVEVVRGASAGDIQLVPHTEDAAGAPDASQSDASQDQAADGADDDADAEATAAAADQADLEQYPEDLREYVKGIPQDKRKGFHEFFGQREREQARVERERADKFEADTKAAAAERQKILDRHGKFVGEAPIELTDPQGNVVQGPTYKELTDLLQTRKGRETLWDKYSLTEDTAEAVKVELDQRQDMLGSSAKHFADTAWGTLTVGLKMGVDAVPGLDSEAVFAAAQQAWAQGGNGPATVIAQVVAARDAEHARELSAVKRDYEGRIKALDVNGEAMAGRVIAAESRRLPTGGRTGGGSGEPEHVRLARENPDEFRERAMRGDFANLDLTK